MTNEELCDEISKTFLRRFSSDHPGWGAVLILMPPGGDDACIGANVELLDTKALLLLMVTKLMGDGAIDGLSRVVSILRAEETDPQDIPEAS